MAKKKLKLTVLGIGQIFLPFPKQSSNWGPFYSLFFFVNFFILPNIYISSHAHGSIPDTMSKATEVLWNIRAMSENFFTWFQNSSMKANLDKFHL